MKKLLLISIILIFNSYSVYAKEPKCDTALGKLNLKCNFIGKGIENMKKFSENNKTLDQSYENIKATVEKKIKKK